MSPRPGQTPHASLMLSTSPAPGASAPQAPDAARRYALMLALQAALASQEADWLPPDCGLSVSEARVLVLVVRWPGRDAMSVGQLALAAHLEQSVATRHLERLERAGLLRRKYCPRDRRVRRVWLTRRGLTLAQRLDEVYAQRALALSAQAPAQDAIDDLITRLLLVMSASDPEASPPP